MGNETKICIDCDREFEITEGWKKLLEDHPELQLPKRCYRCRQKRRQEKEKSGRY